MCYFTAEVMTDIDVLVPLFKLEIEMFYLHFSGRVRHTWFKSCWIDHIYEFTFTFTFMHLAGAFIQSDLHCIQVTVFTFDQLLLSLGIEPMILALLAPCSTT